MPADDDELIGQVLHDSYHVVRLIGEGGMGSVYEARHVRLGKKRFAIKFLHRSIVEMPDVYARFRREAEIATELGNPHIVDVIDFNETAEGQPYMVMEFLEGEDLAVRIGRESPLEPALVLAIAKQVGSALQAAHERGIVHRDMKPENIFLVESGAGLTAKVLDFGISKIRHSKSVVTCDNALLGTPYFMSPEQAEGSVKDIDHTTDLFALGGICYQALCGEMPFDAPTIVGVLYQVCKQDPKPITELVPALPRAVEQVLARAMAKRRADRYPQALDFIEELEGALGTAIVQPGAEPAARRRPPTGPSLPLDSVPTILGPADSDEPPSEDGATAEPGGQPTPITTVPGRKQKAVPADAAPVRTMSTLSGSAAELTRLPQVPTNNRRTVVIAAAAVVVIAAGITLASTLGSDAPSSNQPQTVAVTGAAPATAPKAAPTAASATKAADRAPAKAVDPAPAKAVDTAPAKAVDPAPAKASAPAARSIAVKLRLSPRSARVTIDGEPVSSPLVRLVASDKPRLVRAEARGFQPLERRLVLDRSRTLPLALVKKRRLPRSSARTRPKKARRRTLKKPAPKAPAKKSYGNKTMGLPEE